MTVIRGATTIAEDTPDEIRAAVKELLEQIESRNALKRDEVVSIVFSSTSDIHSFYPAKAAREAGFESCSLFSAQEPDIEGGLKFCIRVMLFVEKNETPRHVYLRGARVLRKDVAQTFCVAIDGPAGSGKSTIAKLLARDYNILYLDTGAMYRACALACLRAGADVSDEAKVCDVLRSTSPVLDGRDIGTFVLPDADFKFFLTAAPKVRAKRRADELAAKGYEVDLDALLKEIVARDEQDAAREIAPLKKADDAVLVDTSSMTIEEVLKTIKSKIQEKI